MKLIRLHRWLRLIIPGVAVFELSGCLGPNPGFFVGTSVANATISTLVSAFLKAFLGLGGG
ncbi:MAG: hypothetical protein ACE5EQ_09625 [Phycisphaerae bacterium]